MPTAVSHQGRSRHCGYWGDYGLSSVSSFLQLTPAKVRTAVYLQAICGTVILGFSSGSDRLNSVRATSAVTAISLTFGALMLGARGELSLQHAQVVSDLLDTSLLPLFIVEPWPAQSPALLLTHGLRFITFSGYQTWLILKAPCIASNTECNMCAMWFLFGNQTAISSNFVRGIFIILYGGSFTIWLRSVFCDPGPLYYWMALRAILSKEKNAEFEEIAREVRNYEKYNIRTNLRGCGLSNRIKWSCMALGQEDATLTAVLSVMGSVPMRFFALAKFAFQVPRCQRTFCAFLVIGYKVFATERGLNANLKDSGNIWAFGQFIALALAIPAILEVLRLLKFAISEGHVGLPISVPSIPRERRCSKLADGTYMNLRPDS